MKTKKKTFELSHDYNTHTPFFFCEHREFIKKGVLFKCPSLKKKEKNNKKNTIIDFAFVENFIKFFIPKFVELTCVLLMKTQKIKNKCAFIICCF